MRIIGFLVVLLGLASCKQKHGFNKVWLFDHAEYPGRETRVEREDSKYLLFSSQTFLNIQDDGKYTAYFGKFEQGTWDFRDSVIRLKPGGGPLVYFIVKQLGEHSLQLYYPERGSLYHFDGFNQNFPSDTEDPFSYSNNRWREKAMHPETDEEIAKRLKNHFRFYEKYFAWGKNTNRKVMDITITPSVLDIYSNGFKLEYFNDQSPQWQHIFYSTFECWRAYEIVYYLMYKKEIEWPKTENNFERLASAFKQLQEWMDTDPKTYLPARDSTRMLEK